MKSSLTSTLLIMICVVILSGTRLNAQAKRALFAKDNLVAWCIVPYDTKNRNSEERALMLNELGINKLAYDWRQKNIPEFDTELQALKKHNIKLQSFWLMSGPDPEKEGNLKTILDALKRNDVKTEIWLMMVGIDGTTMTQQQRVEAYAGPVKYIAEEAAKAGCSVGLYNHGGWYGEPENQLAIIDHLKMKNVGIVYNFHHAEEQVMRFPEFFPKILPHLMTLNISGLQGTSPAKVVPVGEGDQEARLMKIVKDSAYKGPIGIINEETRPDAREGLMVNMDGIVKILKEQKDGAALKSYGSK